MADYLLLLLGMGLATYVPRWLPLHYLSRGVHRAVLGGWDPSARKFFKTDELSFTIPLKIFLDMLQRYDTSFLKTKTWLTVQKKITRSQKAWGEGQGSRV